MIWDCHHRCDPRRALATAVLLSALAACSGASGSLAGNAAVSASPWVVLDLDAGTVTPLAGAPDTADAQWRGRRILFRLLPPGEAWIGCSLADPLAELDERPRRRVATTRLWVAALELTQAQWTALGGGTPWYRAVPAADLGQWIGDGMPAVGMTPLEAEAVLGAWSRDGWVLDLPSGTEWEAACLAGSGQRFAWGDSLDGGAGWAVCASDAAPRPAPCGGRQGNALGLADVHGNAAELVRETDGWSLRGGSWDQPVAAARASNRQAIAFDEYGWSAGLRPVLRR
jgi:formylglycine-generating enzyme required for sulfatase activity